MYSYGWINEGIAFYASRTEKTNTLPAYRLQKNGIHYYTIVQSEYNSMKNIEGWGDEGIAFYVPSSATVNTSHKIYRLQNPSNGKYYWTTDNAQRNLLKNSGYTAETSPFNSLSGVISAPATEAGRNNIYRAKSNSSFFYTPSLVELEAVVRGGYAYEGVTTTTPVTNTGTAVFRLRYSGNKYFYTASASERDTAVQTYGMNYEGIGFYVDSSSAQIYRMANTKYNTYLYTSDFNEIMKYANIDGWTYEDVLVESTADLSPVYRFLNQFNARHFYTIHGAEATRIANKGWQYETVAFYANKATGDPVYRLLLRDKHFFTSNINERDVAVKKFGYLYEGVAFYVSNATTSKPAYRLQGGNDEYFYTASSQEKDIAVNRYGYQYEGEGFYLP
jgi:hypothetical protein